jgi:hypothetical protein
MKIHVDTHKFDYELLNVHDYFKAPCEVQLLMPVPKEIK